MTLHPSHPDYVTSLARGLQVIQAFSSTEPEMTLSEVSKATGLSAATARRFLLTLEALGYVRQYNRRFVLTARVLQLGATFVESMNLNEVAQLYLQELVDTFYDASSLTILDGNDIVYIVHIPSNRPARLRQHVGARMPAHGASMGYILFNSLSDEEFAHYVAQAPFPAFTDKTPTTAEEISQRRSEAKAKGYAIIQDGVGIGTIAIAVPITDQKGRIVAAINCSTDSMRVDPMTLIETRLPKLQQAAQQISNQLIRYPALCAATGVLGAL